MAGDDCPGQQEDDFHVEQDEQHRDYVEADREAAACIAFGNDAALIGLEFGDGTAMLADKEGAAHHARSQSYRGKNLHEQGKVVPEVMGCLHAVLALGRPWTAPRVVSFEIRVRLQLSQASAVKSHVCNERVIERLCWWDGRLGAFPNSAGTS